MAKNTDTCTKLTNIILKAFVLTVTEEKNWQLKTRNAIKVEVKTEQLFLY